MKKILVLGGSGHIGEAVVKELNSTTLTSPIFTYNNKLIKDKNGLQCDITSSSSINTFIDNLKEKSKRLDGLIICTGAPLNNYFTNPSSKFNYNKLEEITSKNWIEITEFYGLHTFNIIQKVIPFLKTDNTAKNIVLIGSLTNLKSVRTPIHLAGAKSITRGLVDALSQELGEYNILVNSIDPGVLIGGQSKYFSNQLKNDYLKHSSLKRFGEASEVAKVATWIVCKNTFITAKSFLLDGGL